MNDITHSLMFHHFHDERHLPAQGSLSSSDFIKMIDWLNKHYSILNASQYKENFEKGTLKNTDICLSFDDALKCQYDVAVPVMERLGIEAFFFIYTSIFTGEPDYLEIFRLFRTSSYTHLDDFYEEFFSILTKQNKDEVESCKSTYRNLDYLSDCPFYSEDDKWFRYLRDNYCSVNQYRLIMFEMMKQKKFDIEYAKTVLWMNENEVKNLYDKGHTIGLHSHSHPTQMSKMCKSDQRKEYTINQQFLSRITCDEVNTVSYPCGSYNQDTLEVLSEIGIKMGFRASMEVREIKSPLEIPREDHAVVFAEMQL